MPERREIYKCEKCGNVVEILHGGSGSLVCCGEEMKLQNANSVDTSQEKHVPVIKKDGDTCTVSVGSTPHPMEKEHYIEMVEVLTKEGIQRVYLHPGEKPEARFTVPEGVLGAREYCTVHGLWQST